MEPRIRAGLIGGGGAAIATFFLSLVFLCFSGPLIAILGGMKRILADMDNRCQIG